MGELLRTIVLLVACSAMGAFTYDLTIGKRMEICIDPD